MFEKSDNHIKREKELYQKVKKKYNTKPIDPIDHDKENLANIESTKFNNFLKFKSMGSNIGSDSDFFIMDSDREILNKQKGGKVSKNYDLDK